MKVGKENSSFWMFVPRLSPDFGKYWTTVNMAFLDQLVDEYLKKKKQFLGFKFLLLLTIQFDSFRQWPSGDQNKYCCYLVTYDQNLWH